MSNVQLLDLLLMDDEIVNCCNNYPKAYFPYALKNACDQIGGHARTSYIALLRLELNIQVNTLDYKQAK